MILPPITRVWHGVDVILAVAGMGRKPTMLNAARLAFALVGLAGNIVISRQQLASKEITIEGVKYRRANDELSVRVPRN
jgi:uncharacterized membrane protein YuzA (DUF378 family)